MPSVHLWPYEGSPPEATDIQTRLGLEDSDYLYFVATSGQQLMRRPDFRPPLQEATEPDADTVRLVFREAVKAVMIRTGFRDRSAFLSGSESRIVVRRAIRSLQLDPRQEELLLHDAGNWQLALAEMASRGGDMGFDLNPTVGALLGQLDDAYAAACSGLEPTAEPVDAAIRAFIDAGLPGSSVSAIVFEGFTFLTPLQRAFIERAQQSTDVHCIFPFRSEQEGAFAIMRRTYGAWWPEEIDSVPAAWDPDSGRLGALQQGLFGEREASGEHDDQSVEFAVHRYRQEEVAACIERIQTEGLSGAEAAIVTTDPSAYVPILREEAERQKLTVALTASPRRLLLTAVGQFVLSLYEAWDPTIGDLHLDAETFEAILASGWISPDWRHAVRDFHTVRQQSFGACHNAEEWRAELGRLSTLIEERETARAHAHDDADDPLPAVSREPISGIDPEIAAVWVDALNTVERLCRGLFERGERSIADHVRQLLDELDSLPTRDLQEAEREIIERVRSELMDAAAGTRLEIGAEEFSELLIGMVREHDEYDADPREAGPEDDGDGGGEDDDGDGGGEDDGRIWVTTPVGIDGIERDVIFLLGCDDQRFPNPYHDSWPYADVDVEEHLQRQRYLYLAVVRAARQALHISFSRTDLAGTYGPSPYWLVSQRFLRDEWTGPAEEGGPQGEFPEPAVGPAVRRDDYSIDEVAHFALCPYRYKLERLDPRNRLYESHFQLVFLAQGVWPDLVCRYLESEAGRYRSDAEVAAALDAAFSHTRREIKRRFPGLSAGDWRTVEAWAQKRVANMCWGLKVHPRFAASFQPARRSESIEIEVETAEGVSLIDVTPLHYLRRGRWTNSLVADIFGREWLIPAKPDQDEVPAPPDLELLANRYEANQWWRDAVYKQGRGGDRFQPDRAANLVGQIEAGHYPRRPGEHCGYCPSREPCLGKPSPISDLRDDLSADEAEPGETGELNRSTTDEQDAIVEHVRDHPITVASAGAGTGKTHTMVAAVVAQLDERRTTTDRLALITFTNQAATELRERLRQWLNAKWADAADDWDEWEFWLSQSERLCAAHVGTIHSFCRRLLEQFGYAVGVPRSATTGRASLLFVDELEGTLDAALTGEDGDGDGDDVPSIAATSLPSHELRKLIRQIYEYCQTNEIDTAAMREATKELDNPDPDFALAFAIAVQRLDSTYSDAKQAARAIDFDDEIQSTRDLLGSGAAALVLDRVQGRFDHLFVDEFQDTDRVQAEIVAGLIPAIERMLIVGDPRQAIYAWRGAVHSLLDEFAERHQVDPMKPLPLNISRRPTQALLDAQQALFRRMSEKGRYPELGGQLEAQEDPLDGGPSHPIIVDGGESNADRIASYIRELLEGRLGEIADRSDPRPIVPGDIAILARSNFEVRKFEREVTEALGHDWTVRNVTGGRYFARPEIVSTLRMLELFLDPRDPTTLSLALDTPYLFGLGHEVVEAAILAGEHHPSALWEWLEADHPAEAERISSFALRARTDTPAQVISSLYEAYRIREFFGERGHARAVGNLGKLQEQAYRLFTEEEALALRVFSEWLRQRILTERPEPDASTPGQARQRPGYIRAMTIHAAKGLQFPIVIIPGAQRQLNADRLDPSFLVHQGEREFPTPALDVDIPVEGTSTRSHHFQTALEEFKHERTLEEMRLLYVAITRAEQCVIVIGGGGDVRESDDRRYSWKDEIRRARDELERENALFCTT